MSFLSSPFFRSLLCPIGWACLLAHPVPLFAGAWTLPEGEVWGKLTYFQQQTREWYLATPEFAGGQPYPAGARRPYRFGGRYSSRAVFLEASYGIADWLEAGVQFPYFDQQLEDDTRLEPPAEAGFGDLRFSLRWRVLREPLVFTLKGALKAPTGDFRNEDGLIPVGEGQWDLDLMAQVGRSFWPLPLYGNLDLGYRVRLENARVAQDPGDEWLFEAEVGGQLADRVSLAGKFEVVRGRAEPLGPNPASPRPARIGHAHPGGKSVPAVGGRGGPPEYKLHRRSKWGRIHLCWEGVGARGRAEPVGRQGDGGTGFRLRGDPAVLFPPHRPAPPSRALGGANADATQ